MKYRKTAIASEALARRTPALSLRERALLIMLDGRRTLDELAVGFEGVEELIRGLAAAGLVEPVQEMAPERPKQPPVHLSHAQRLAVRRINDLLGPAGTDLCIRIEGSRSLADFRAAIKRGQDVLRDALGAGAADQFCQEVEATLSPAGSQA